MKQDCSIAIRINCSGDLRAEFMVATDWLIVDHVQWSLAPTSTDSKVTEVGFIRLREDNWFRSYLIDLIPVLLKRLK